MTTETVPVLGAQPPAAPAPAPAATFTGTPPEVAPAPAPVVPGIAPAAEATPPPSTAAGGDAPPAAPLAVTPEMQEYVAGLERERAALEVERAEVLERRDMQGLEEDVAAYAQRLQEQGYTPEQADTVAQRERQQALRDYRADRARQFREGQINAALHYGQQLAVDPRRLMNLPTPAAMVQAATQAKAQGNAASELAALRAENEALKKKLVPATTYASPAGAPGSVVSGPITRERLASMTPAEYRAWRDNGGVK